MEPGEAKIISLQERRGGAAGGIRERLCAGRDEIVTAGPNSEFGFVGSDPYNTAIGTGLVVPATPTATLGGRYLLLLARRGFQAAEEGVRLTGIRLYAEMVARIPARTGPLATGSGPATGSTVVFRREIESPLWHPFDGSISFHVMVLPRTQRDVRNPATAFEGIAFEDAQAPALLYQTIAGPPTAPTAYTPPNGGRPWGTPLAASLGNIHELRYPWRRDDVEYVLDVRVPVACDVALFASVRQNDPATNPALSDTTVTQQFVALSDEDRFVVAYNAFAQYGVVAGALTFNQNVGEDEP